VSRVTIELASLELRGFHGATAREREEGQPFLFDVALVVDAVGAETDVLADTVDYREVVAVVREVSDSTRFKLIEALAATLAETLLDRFALLSVRVRVRKPAVELDAPVAYSAVTVERAAAAPEGPGR